MNSPARPVCTLCVFSVVLLLRLSALGSPLEAPLVATSTPGAGSVGPMGNTRFIPERGFYFAPIDVRIRSDTAGAKLVYAIDASEPSLMHGHTVAGTNAIVHITTTTVLRAAAFKDGYQAGNTETHSYLFPAAVANQTRPASLKASWP